MRRPHLLAAPGQHVVEKQHDLIGLSQGAHEGDERQFRATRGIPRSERGERRLLAEKIRQLGRDCRQDTAVGRNGVLYSLSPRGDSRLRRAVKLPSERGKCPGESQERHIGSQLVAFASCETAKNRSPWHQLGAESSSSQRLST